MPTCIISGTTTSTTDNGTWILWNHTDCTSATISSSDNSTWVTWTNATIVTDSTSVVNDSYIPRSQESLERIRVEEHERCQREADSKQAEKDRIAARKRAMKLLLSNLTKKQKKQYSKYKYFVIEGGKSKRKYRIRGNPDANSIPMANIDVLHHDNDNDVDYRICFHLSYGIPLGDHLLAQKLMLENDEDRAIEVSNRHAT